MNMGYISYIYLDELTRRKEYTSEDVLKAYTELKDEALKIDGPDGGISQKHWFSQLGQDFIDINGTPEVDESDAKWYGEWTEPMIKWLAQYFHGVIDFCGEDNLKWRYVLPEDEKGVFKYIECREYYGELIDHFISIYNDKLPETLKKELLKFKVILKI
jgi:hypothetical protein